MTKQRILITGASSGIGRACVVHFANLGDTVFAGVRKTSDGEALQEDSAGDLRPVLLDVADSRSIQAALLSVGDEPLAGLVNNAGIAVMGPLELVPIEDWRHQFEINVLGLVAITRPCDKIRPGTLQRSTPADCHTRSAAASGFRHKFRLPARRSTPFRCRHVFRSSHYAAGIPASQTESLRPGSYRWR
jgi:NAD(P)-dependent dehydrogenase (short-subunit alcohol dehydrogenase family)